MKATIVYHYLKDDPKFELAPVEVELILNNRPVKRFKTFPELNAFLQGIVYTTGHDYMREEKNVADKELENKAEELDKLKNSIKNIKGVIDEN